MLEDLLFCMIMLFICFIFLYIISCLMYLFELHNVTEDDMISFYKNQWKNRKTMRKDKE